MDALTWAAKNITFDEATSLVGRFDIEKYRMLKRPLMELDNIHTKRMTIYKASSAGGTILLQIAISFWLDQRPGGIQVAMQSDEACDDWMILRGKKWLTRIPSLAEAMSKDKHAITNKRWQWPHAWLLLTGPGESAQQAKQVRFFASDEAHTENFKPGALAAFEERMGKRWQRMGMHVSTAADDGKEIDKFYYSGGQNEFHLACPKCNGLVWPLWEGDAEAQYNGEKVFHFGHDDSSPKFICPFCSAEYHDTSRDRRALHEGSDYVCKNPNRDIENESFRWNCFGAWFMEWSGHLLKFRESIEAAKMGDLKPHEDWIKKRLCQSYKPHLPDFGEGHGSENYSLADVWEAPDQTRIITVDYQAGKKAEGSHLWALLTAWTPTGDSRRLAFRKFETWAQLRQFQLDCGVESRNVYVDCGYDDRTVFSQCGLYHWYAVQGSPNQQFHTITIDRGKPTQHTITFPMPYSQTERANGNVGAKQPDKLKTNLQGALPPGWCLKLVMGNDQLYGYLHALQSGATGRYFGIARDMPDTYTAGFPAFIPVVQKNKQTNVESVIWRKVKPIDHPWDTEVMALMGAMRASCYPLKETQPEQKPEFVTV